MLETPKRPKLREIPIADAVPLRPGTAYVTCSLDQWDSVLSAAYSGGWVLIELR